MDKKSSLPAVDVALENLDPTRRHFLGLLLAGAATLPALTTTALAAQDSAKSNGHITKPVISSNQKSAPDASEKHKDGSSSAAPSEKTAPSYKEKWPSSDATIKDKGGSSASPSDREKSGIGTTQKNSNSNTVKGSDAKTVKQPNTTQKAPNAQTQPPPEAKQKPSTSDSHIYMK